MTKSVCDECSADGKNCENELKKFQSQNYELQQFLQNEMQDPLYLINYLHLEDNDESLWEISQGLEMFMNLATFSCRMGCNKLSN